MLPARVEHLVAMQLLSWPKGWELFARGESSREETRTVVEAVESSGRSRNAEMRSHRTTQPTDSKGVYDLSRGDGADDRCPSLAAPEDEQDGRQA